MRYILYYLRDLPHYLNPRLIVLNAPATSSVASAAAAAAAVGPTDDNVATRVCLYGDFCGKKKFFCVRRTAPKLL